MHHPPGKSGGCQYRFQQPASLVRPPKFRRGGQNGCYSCYPNADPSPRMLHFPLSPLPTRSRPMPTATAVANANIAMIKYWGNRDDKLRLPANPSLSIKLAGLETETTI